MNLCKIIGFSLCCLTVDFSRASVEVQFIDGRKETFGSVASIDGKLQCKTKHGTAEFSLAQLAEKDRKLYFSQLEKTPSEVEASREAISPPLVAPVPVQTLPTKPPTPTAKSFFHFFSGELRPSAHDLIGFPARLEDVSYFIQVPANYDGRKPFGLVAFIPAGDQMELPAGWEKVLEEKELLYIAPQNAGNALPTLSERLGLVVAGVLKMKDEYQIDPERVYVAGFSGGARCATTLGYYASDMFSGSIGICGANFHEAVPRKEATKEDNYGVQPASEKEIRNAKRKVRFAIITGETDWRRGNIRDLFLGGFEKQKFQVRLWDVQGLGHAICGPETFREAVDFIEAGEIR